MLQRSIFGVAKAKQNSSQISESFRLIGVVCYFLFTIIRQFENRLHMLLSWRHLSSVRNVRRFKLLVISLENHFQQQVDKHPKDFKQG